MRWSWFFILLFLSCIYMYTIDRFFPSYSFIDPTLIACFLILRSPYSKRTLIMVFIFTFIIDLVCLGSHIKGITTMAVLPIIYLGTFLKDYILPIFSDVALFIFFFFGFLVNYLLTRWLFGVFSETIPRVAPVYLGFQLLVHCAIFGAILILLGRIKGKRT